MNGPFMAAVHASLTVTAILAAPRRDATPRALAGAVWISIWTTVAYLSSGWPIAALSLAAATLPFVVTGVFERGAPLPLALLMAGRLGALTLARVFLALPPAMADAARPWLIGTCLLAAAATGLLAFKDARPRRALLWLMSGQGAVILAGWISGGTAGQAGAVALWLAAGVSTTMLAIVYAALEARLGRQTLERPGFLGLAAVAPRLSVFFCVAALAFGDLPFTMGFPAAELLQRGLLEVAPVGLLLPAVSGLNAFVALRLFARLFWGHPLEAARDTPDALPRERWALTAALAFLLIGGLFPSTFLP